MNQSEDIYQLQRDETVQEMRYFFMSKSEKKDVIKIINYAFLEKNEGKNVYNLGFGDYSFEHKRVVDNINTDNGDARKVFNTVLNTIPSFFEKYPGEMLIVQGSDSRPGFKETCRETCKKKCPERGCKKFNQRIRIYKSFVDTRFDALNADYQFFGGYRDEEGKTYKEDYVMGRDYYSVLVIKRNA